MANIAWTLVVVVVLFCSSASPGQFGTGFTPFAIQGPGVLSGALEPALRKWYVPQELFNEFGWTQWNYSNYARDLYQRYTDVALEGTRFYDIYGNYITRGWRIYDWSQEQPRSFGSTVFKNPRYSSWFSNLVVSSASKGQNHMALTVGDQIRTTLTPLTFSQATFNGVQLDYLSDKFAVTVLASRASDPGLTLQDEARPPRPTTDFANFVGLRSTAQVGDLLTLGGTYANVFLGKSIDDWADNSLKGQLTSAQNGTRVRKITIRLRDDSPEDGEGGALFFGESVFIDGRKAELSPVVKGGVVRHGRREASGSDEIFLVYDLEGWSYVDDEDVVRDVNWFQSVTFQLVLANDYRVDITSNTQVDLNGQEIFLPVARAGRNVRDATNQRIVRFDYGLPTGNEIYGLTMEATDLYGVWVRAEWDVNRRHRRFPNPNRAIAEHAVATDRAHAYYLSAQRLFHPWFLYGEGFSIGNDYTTTVFIPDKSGRVIYDRPEQYWFEMVDDNDDQDRLPDWDRNPVNQTAGSEVSMLQSRLGGIFPGLDENNDFVSDFNQNDNYQPDYEEPFIRFNVDAPEFLFGMDMNNNTIIDRFENDTEPDYPYKRDHRGFNLYGGAEVLRGVKTTVGYLSERLMSSGKASKALYGLLTCEQDFPDGGVLRVFEYARRTRDHIPENLEQWEQLPNAKGGLIPFDDPLVAQDTWINTFYADYTCARPKWLALVNKLKHEVYVQRGHPTSLRERAHFVGLVNKAHSRFAFGNLNVAPKVKSEFTYRTPFIPGRAKERSLWESAILLVSYPFMGSSQAEVGIEYTLYLNLLDRSVILTTPDQVDDFHGLVLAAEYANAMDYLGYHLTSKVGFRQQTQFFEKRTKTGNVFFVQIFAGLGQ
jgi:hypothetical protein